MIRCIYSLLPGSAGGGQSDARWCQFQLMIFFRGVLRFRRRSGCLEWLGQEPSTHRTLRRRGAPRPNRALDQPTKPQDDCFQKPSLRCKPPVKVPSKCLCLRSARSSQKKRIANCREAKRVIGTHEL